MENISWLKQVSEPLFPDVLWSRPENRRRAGKLLIIGGHSQSFSAVSRSYSAAQAAGAGTIRVLLPSSLQKTLGKSFAQAEFADSTGIGSFSRQALGLFLELSNWADGVFLTGEFGRNSETAILLESYVSKYAGQLTLTGDSIDYFYQHAGSITDRPATTIAGSLAQIQKLAPPAVRQQAQLAQLLDLLSIFTRQAKASILTEQSGQIIVARQGKISTTPAKNRGIDERVGVYASVWTLQQPQKPFEALTTAVYCVGQE